MCKVYEADWAGCRGDGDGVGRGGEGDNGTKGRAYELAGTQHRREGEQWLAAAHPCVCAVGRIERRTEGTLLLVPPSHCIDLRNFFSVVYVIFISQ